MKREWVLVADGSMAKLLKKENCSLVHVFPTYYANEMVSPIDRDSDRLGKVHESYGTARHAHSPHEEYKYHQKREFIKQISSIVNDSLESYDRLVIIAPAERLGEIRSHLTPAVKDKVIQEINKDLVKSSLEKVYQYAANFPKS